VNIVESENPVWINDIGHLNRSGNQIIAQHINVCKHKEIKVDFKKNIYYFYLYGSSYFKVK